MENAFRTVNGNVRRLSLTTIVNDLAERETKRIVARTIRALQRLRDTMSGDDSGLSTVWDEVCVQVQCEHSIYWSTYMQVIETFVAAYVEELPTFVRDAIWLQTQDGFEWDCEDEEDRLNAPVEDAAITEYLVSAILSAADDWSNSRIRTYKNRRYEYD